MPVHFSVVVDGDGRILHVLSGDSTVRAARNISELVSGDAQALLDRARVLGSDFSAELELAGSDERAAMAAVGSAESILAICAANAQELTSHLRCIRSPNDPVLGTGDGDADSHDRMTRLNNELINAQRELAKLNARYSRDLEKLGETLARIGSGIIVLNSEAEVEMMNEAAAAKLGVADDPAGKRLEQLLRLSAGTAFHDAEEDKLHRWRVEALHGGTLELYGSVNRIGANNKVIAFQDISEILRLEKELMDSNELLRLILKVTRHDLLNHLTVAQGYIELSGSYEGDERLQRSSEALSKAEGIIRQMRDLESLVLEKGDKERTGLAATVETAMQGHPMDWTIEGDATVLADPALPSVIDNIVDNAVKHGDADRLDFRVRNEGDRSVLSIADNGSGIPPEIKERLFQEGFSHGKAANTGLGLYLADQVMRRYGGSISVEDNRPSGALFHLSFPRLDPS